MVNFIKMLSPTNLFEIIQSSVFFGGSAQWCRDRNFSVLCLLASSEYFLRAVCSLALIAETRQIATVPTH